MGKLERGGLEQLRALENGIAIQMVTDYQGIGIDRLRTWLGQKIIK